MPKYWHDRHSVNVMDDENEKDFQRSIVADKKPYFMKYIYPDLMKQYNKYIRNTDRNALREFQMSVDELSSLPSKDLSEQQQDFLRYYYKRLPVGTHDCVMNRICRRFEEEFDGHIKRHNAETTFDSEILKSGVEYSKTQYDSIRRLYENFNKQLQNYKVFAYYEDVEDEDSLSSIHNIREEFERDCMDICQNGETLLDILVDICYKRSNTKRFVWEMCRHEIIANLLKKNDYILSFPEIDPEGDIEYGGERFSIRQVYMGDANESCNE